MKELDRLSDTDLLAWKSNEIFSEETQNRIRDVLSLTQREIESLNLEMTTTRSSGKTPSNEQLLSLTKKKEEVEILRGAISSLKKLPNEVLCELFLYSNNSMSSSNIPCRRSRAFPWVLGHVCSRWRDVFWGVSSFWETIRIWADVRDAEIPALIDVFQTILSHSSAQISLVAPHNEQLFSELVLPNLARLRGLEIILGQESFQTLFELPKGSVDSLTSVDLHFRGGDLPHLADNPFLTAPNLRKVTLTNNFGVRRWPHLSWLWPWAQLTDINLPTSSMPTPTLHTILSQCASLRTASLVIGSDKSPDLGEEVIVPKLESLVLHRHGSAPDWGGFLRPLVLPSFQSILVPNAQTWSQAAFASLVTRSGCPLKSVYLAFYSDDTHDLFLLLKQAPSLRELILPWLHVPASVFEAMRRGGILPILRHLECIVDPLGLNAVLNLIESPHSGKSGIEPGIGLQVVTLICSKEGEFEDSIKRFNNLQPKFLENGLNIKVHPSS